MESTQNTVTIKVENDTDVVTEEDPIGVNTDGVCIQSGFSVPKAEPENCMDLVKAEPGSCSKTWLTSSHDENLVIDMKVEEDTDEEEEYPVSMVFAAVKSENEVCSV